MTAREVPTSPEHEVPEPRELSLEDADVPWWVRDMHRRQDRQHAEHMAALRRLEANQSAQLLETRRVARDLESVRHDVAELRGRVEVLEDRARGGDD